MLIRGSMIVLLAIYGIGTVGCSRTVPAAKVMNAQAEMDSGLKAMESKMFADAIPHFTAAIDSTLLDGEMLGEAWLSRARCYAETGQFELAEGDLAACEQSPVAGSAQEMIVRGILYRKQGKASESDEAFSKARELEPEIVIPAP